MSESVFASIIEEYAAREWASYADSSEFKTSKRHDRAMKRIFKRFDRNTKRLSSERKFRAAPKRLLIFIAIILLLITGCSIVYFSTLNINVELHNDGMTEFSVINTKNSPALIEELYIVSAMPDEFEETLSSVKYSPEPSGNLKYSKVYQHFEDLETHRQINFTQSVKPGFEPHFLEIKNDEWTQVEINGHYGVMYELNNNKNCLMWDNGDYIFVLAGNIDKSVLPDLAKSIKLLTDSDSYQTKLNYLRDIYYRGVKKL